MQHQLTPYSVALVIAAHLLIMISPSTLATTNTQIQSALDTFQSASSEADYKEALAQFQSLYKSNPEDANLAYYYGRSLYRAQRFEEADKVLTKNIERHPNHVESHYVIGSVKLSRVSEVSIFKKIGMAKAAIAAWEKTVELDPTHVEALYGVVEFYLNAPGMAGGDKALGEQKLRALEMLSPAWADLSKASIAVRADAFDDAEPLFASAIEGIPNRAFPELMLVNAHLKQEKYGKALTALDSYRQRERKWNDPGVPHIELMAAKIYQGLNQIDDAEKAVTLALNNDPPENVREQAEALLKAIR